MLFAATPQQSVSAEVMRSRYLVFCEALSDMPFWAIRSAALKWIRGEAKGNPAFAPSAGELARLSQAETLPHRALLEKLRRVLIAKPLQHIETSPEERAKVAARFGDLLKTFNDRDGAPA